MPTQRELLEAGASVRSVFKYDERARSRWRRLNITTEEWEAGDRPMPCPVCGNDKKTKDRLCYICESMAVRLEREAKVRAFLAGEPLNV